MIHQHDEIGLIWSNMFPNAPTLTTYAILRITGQNDC